MNQEQAHAMLWSEEKLTHLQEQLTGPWTSLRPTCHQPDH